MALTIIQEESFRKTERKKEVIPGASTIEPAAKLEAAVIALNAERVQFHMPLLLKLAWLLLVPSKHSKNSSTLQQNDHHERVIYK